jgi:hypothetical protein
MAAVLGFLWVAPVATEVRAQVRRPVHVPAISFNRIPASYWDWGEGAHLAAKEIEQLVPLLDKLDIRSEYRPGALNRLAADHVALKILALREGRAVTTWGIDPVTRARDGAIAYWSMLIREYSGAPSPTFPEDPPPAYPGLETAYYCLAYEYEDAGASAEARRAYIEIVKRWPDAEATSFAYLALGDFAFDAAMDDARQWAVAKRNYLNVVADPYPPHWMIRLQCHAHYKLAYVAWNQGDLRGALQGFRKTIACTRGGSIPETARLAHEAGEQILAIPGP